MEEKPYKPMPYPKKTYQRPYKPHYPHHHYPHHPHMDYCSMMFRQMYEQLKMCQRYERKMFKKCFKHCMGHDHRHYDDCDYSSSSSSSCHYGDAPRHWAVEESTQS
ncbi:hypothetical protein SAMN05444392_10843 [Seinonella peptonophila]|uniref:Uncharacterized protein n=1 Tax=Seinonella peptonophila TaxID=112248 RepID=A0A1M4Z5N7_9BACL|nr:hypothetical protein SAMN05444392_10843 [Seinonella peptonophila]